MVNHRGSVVYELHKISGHVLEGHVCFLPLLLLLLLFVDTWILFVLKVEHQFFELFCLSDHMLHREDEVLVYKL